MTLVVNFRSGVESLWHCSSGTHAFKVLNSELFWAMQHLLTITSLEIKLQTTLSELTRIFLPVITGRDFFFSFTDSLV